MTTQLSPGDRPDSEGAAIEEATSQLANAVAAKKYWPCGCLQSSLGTIAAAFPQQRRPAELHAALRAARAQLREVQGAWTRSVQFVVEEHHGHYEANQESARRQSRRVEP